MPAAHYPGNVIREAQTLGESFSFHAAADDFDGMIEFWAAQGTDDEEADVQQWLREQCTDGENHMTHPDALFAAFLETSRSHTSAVLGFAGTYYVVDSHRNDQVTGRKSQDGAGCAVVLRVTGLDNLLRYFRHICTRVKLTMVIY